MVIEREFLQKNIKKPGNENFVVTISDDIISTITRYLLEHEMNMLAEHCHIFGEDEYIMILLTVKKM